MDKENPRIEVGGDPQGGWLIDIHDGANHSVYRPNGKDAIEAVAAAVKSHNELFYPGKSAAEQMQNPMEEPAFVAPAADVVPASSLGLTPVPAITEVVPAPEPIPASEPAAPAADATVTAPT